MGSALGDQRVALVARVRRLIPSGRLRRAVLILAGGTAAAQVIVLLSSPIITRLYSPAEFGAAAAAIGLVTLLLSSTCLTYDDAIPLPANDDRAVSLVVLAGFVAILMAALTGIVLLVAGDQILDAVNAGALTSNGGPLKSYAWLLVGVQLFGGLTLALNGFAIRKRQFPVIATSRMSQSVALVVSQVGAGLAGVGSAGLVLGDALGRAAAAFRLLRKLRWPSGKRIPTTTLRELRSAASRYRRFPLLGTWSALLNSMAIEAPLLVIVALYGATTGGLFALAQRLLAAPAALVVVSISQVFIAEAAEQARANPRELRTLFRVAMRKLFLYAAPAMVVLAVAGAFLIGPVFGERWSEAGTILVVLAPFYLAQIVTSPLGGALDVLERQDLLLVRTVSQIALLAVAVVVGKALGLSALMAIALISAAGVLSYFLYGAISWYAVRRAALGAPAT